MKRSAAMMRLVQISDGKTRRVALVEEPRLRLLDEFPSVYDLVGAAMESGASLKSLIEKQLGKETLDYDPIYRGESPWRLLTPIDHPKESACLLVSGTGLTHLGSAKNRQAMHAAGEHETDSMKMFRWGVEGGRPAPGRIGVPPEWFFKGNGSILRAQGQPLTTPAYAEDGGEEAEIAGVYIIDRTGQPRRIGMAIGNEFSDHLFERKNYLNLAGSKIRTCALGPEIVIDPAIDSEFQTVPGEVSIERGGKVVWSKAIATGEAEMCHNLRNIEHHHFKYETHRRPGDVHVHYFGAHSLSFGDGMRLADGDIMSIRFDGFGRPLRNPLHTVEKSETPVSVLSLS
jgi:hypothetical protein